MRVCMVGYTNFINDARLHRYSQSLLEQGHQVDMVGVGESVGNEPVIQYGVRVFQIHSRDFAESGPVSYLKNLLVFFLRVQGQGIAAGCCRLRAKFHRDPLGDGQVLTEFALAL